MRNRFKSGDNALWHDEEKVQSVQRDTTTSANTIVSTKDGLIEKEDSFIHSFIQAIFIAPLQVLY